MITTRQLSKDQPSAANSARERLLHDPQIRRNKFSHTNSPTEPSITVTFTGEAALTRSEQEQQAIAIARTYKHYYLADIAYQSDCREVIAVIKPLRGSGVDTLKITVDAGGNATIEAEMVSPSAYRLSFRQLLLMIGVLTTAAFIIALASIY